MYRKLLLAIVVAVVAVVAACGDGGHVDHSAGSGRTLDIDMVDNDFNPSSISVKTGETVQFVFHNKGSVRHDAFIGDEAAQMAHEQEMRMSSGMDHGAHDSNAVTVEPGATATLTHVFTSSGTTIIGCHELGHYALGMQIRVNVT